MTTTQELLGKIAALRERLEQARNQTAEAGATGRNPADTLEGLRQRIHRGDRDQQLLHTALRQAAGRDQERGDKNLPPHLTQRARRLLKHARQALNRLKDYAGEPLLYGEGQPEAVHFQDTVLLTDVLLRTLQTLPEQAALQLRLCSGVDVLLGLIQQRLGTLDAVVSEHRTEEQYVDDLAGIHRRLEQDQLEDVNPFFCLAEEVIREASDGRPLVFAAPGWDEPRRFVAGHCLTTARVIARVANEDAHWRSSLLQPVVAALVHDVGMLAVPRGLLKRAAALDDRERGEIERHCHAGASMLEKICRSHPWLTEATRAHHERLNGTGYPAGLLEAQLQPLPRLLAVCDVYAALCVSRPHRAALDTRAALRETLHLAQTGLLDRTYARMLLSLSFYPAGTAIELNDGACGVVIAGEHIDSDDARPARPVVALLTDAERRPLPHPHFLDLSRCEGRHVKRSLNAAERSKAFGHSYPQYL